MTAAVRQHGASGNLCFRLRDTERQAKPVLGKNRFYELVRVVPQRIGRALDDLLSSLLFDNDLAALVDG